MSNTVIYNAIELDYSIAYRNRPKEGDIPPHFHNAAEIYLTLSPLPHALIGDRIYSIAANSLIIVPAYCIHQLFISEVQVYQRYVFTINESWFETVLFHTSLQYEYLKASSMPTILHFDAENFQCLQGIFDQMISAENSDNFLRFSHFFEAMQFIHTAVEALAEHNHNPLILPLSETQKTANRIISYIHEHIGESITISDIAAYCHMNPDYVSRLFKKHTHTTIANFITMQKMSKARLLLDHGYSITQVQEITGYASYAHFFRTFKKQAGITPGEYQRRLLDGAEEK